MIVFAEVKKLDASKKRYNCILNDNCIRVYKDSESGRISVVVLCPEKVNLNISKDQGGEVLEGGI